MGLFSNKRKDGLIPELQAPGSSAGSGASSAGPYRAQSPAASTYSAGGSSGAGGRRDPYGAQQQQQQQQQRGGRTGPQSPGEGDPYTGAAQRQGSRYTPSYVPPSQGGHGYGKDSQYLPANRGGYDPNSRYVGGSQARNELLAGAPDASQQQQRGNWRERRQEAGIGGRYGDEQQQDQALDEDEEVEGIKQEMRFVKQDTLASSRNALRIAREAEETSRATLDKLGEQSDRMHNTTHNLDMAKAHHDRAEDEARELKKLNRSIFRPSFTFNTAAKRDREEQRLLGRHQEEQREREYLRQQQYQSRNRIDNAYRDMDKMAEANAQAHQRAKERSRASERSRYQFEATASDDEVEDEIDENLNDISDVVSRLKGLATAQGQEVGAQNKQLDKMAPKVDTIDTKLVSTTMKLNRIK